MTFSSTGQLDVVLAPQADGVASQVVQRVFLDPRAQLAERLLLTHVSVVGLGNSVADIDSTVLRAVHTAGLLHDKVASVGWIVRTPEYEQLELFMQENANGNSLS